MKYLTLFLNALICITFQPLQGQDNSVRDAEYLVTSGNFQQAVDLLDVYLTQNPSDAKAYIIRALANGNMGRTNDKNRDLKYAKFLNPYAQLYISDSFRSIYYQKKSYSYDFENLSKEFTSTPVKDEYYEIYLQEIVELHAQDSLLSQAITHLSKNDLENTELTLSRIERSEPILGLIYDIRGLLALKKNNLVEAIDFFTLSIEHTPAFPLAYNNRAIAYKLLGEYDLARNDLEIAISLNEEISVFYFTLAKLSESLNERDEAQEFYQQALTLNPDYTEARTNYSLMQKTLGNYSDAMLDLHRIVDETEDDAKSNFIRGGIHLTYGDYEKAIEEFDSYLKLYDQDSDAYFNRGLAKILRGSLEDGCQDISDSVNLESKLNREEIKSAFCGRN